MNRSRMLLILVLGVMAIGTFYIVNQEPEPVSAGPAMVAVTVPALSASEKEGEAAYNASCAACHGKNAAGQEGVAPPFVHRIYEPGHHGDQAFLIAALNGVRAHHWRFGDMPPVEGVTEDEISSIVAYVRALQRANGIE